MGTQLRSIILKLYHIKKRFEYFSPDLVMHSHRFDINQYHRFCGLNHEPSLFCALFFLLTPTLFPPAFARDLGAGSGSAGLLSQIIFTEVTHLGVEFSFLLCAFCITL